MTTPTMIKCLILILMALTHRLVYIAGGALLGVNYGLQGNNLPSHNDVVKLIRSKGIPMVRLYEPNLEAFDAFRGANMNVAVGVNNHDLPNLASTQKFADDWLLRNIIPYKEDINFLWISLGREVIPGPLASYVLPAMKNMQKSIEAAGLAEVILISTVVSTAVIATPYPPSKATFAPEIANIMNDIVSFLYSNTAPLMINVYPYFGLVSDPVDVTLGYALFNSTKVLKDGNLIYDNLYDIMLDGFLAAMVKAVGKNDVDIVVSETGWPSAGNGPYDTIENAKTYNNNLKKHVTTKGTPARPGLLLDTFIFALFNENLKSPEWKQNFGNFYPNMTAVYPLW